MDQETILLTAALLVLTVIMVAGLLHIKMTIRKANDMLLPMYAADLEASKTVAANSEMITANVVEPM